jgi:carboxymethylenebutenolidase
LDIPQLTMEQELTTLVKIPVGADAFDGWLFTPETRGRYPGIVMIPEIFGVNGCIREMARRYASHGFAVMAIDIFWRLQRHVNLGFTKEEFEAARLYHQRFDYTDGVTDMQAAITALRSRPECNGKVGVVGFCLGGTMAYLAGSRTDADAAAGYYGTRIDKFLDDGQKINKPTILHLGRLDHRTPPPIMSAIIEALRGNPNASVYPYDNAKHAFANHQRPDAYDPEITRQADERTFALFKSALSS